MPDNDINRVISGQLQAIINELHAQNCLKFFELTGDQKFLGEAQHFMKLYTNSDVNATQGALGTIGGQPK